MGTHVSIFQMAVFGASLGIREGFLDLQLFWNVKDLVVVPPVPRFDLEPADIMARLYRHISLTQKWMHGLSSQVPRYTTKYGTSTLERGCRCNAPGRRKLQGWRDDDRS